MSEKTDAKTTIFAVRTIIGREKTVQDLIFNKLRTINPVPDLKAILTAELYRGYVFVEAVHQRDIVHVCNGVPHVKGKVVGSIPFDSVEKVIRPDKTIMLMEEGDIVEITSGVFQNNRAQIVKMPKEGAKEEVSVRLLDSDSPITVKMNVDYLKLVEKTKHVTKEYVYSSVKKTSEKTGDSLEMESDSLGADISEEEPAKVVITEEEVGASMDDKFSFDDLDDEDESEDSEETESEIDEDDDEDKPEDDDEWAKFF